MNTNIKKIFITLASTLGALLIVSTSVYAIGTLTPSGTAGDDTQYTLNDIYNKLTNFTASATEGSGISKPGSFVESFNTLSEIYGLLEAEDTDLVAENIKDGVTVFGVEGTKINQITKTGVTTSYFSNDDGDVQAGVEMSFTDNGDGTVTDNNTGLVWQKDGSHFELVDLNTSNYCTDTVESLLPGTGWRVPNIKELFSIINYANQPIMIDPVFINTGSGYLSSTPRGIANYYYVYFTTGTVATEFVDGIIESYIRCVR